ncbi:MAG: ABC transporter permease [Acidobacteriota bacterium]
MFDLERAIRAWKGGLARSQSIEEGYIAELEGHLRDGIEELVGQGMTEEEAFNQVAARLGGTADIGTEFYKACTTRRSGRPPWQPPRFVPALGWNYAKVGLRNMRRHLGYTLINVFGLAAGLTVFLVIGLYVRLELSFDRFHEKSDRIVRIEQIVDDGNSRKATASLPATVISILDFPEIEDVTRFCGVFPFLLRTADGRKLQVERTLISDEGLFRVFSFRLKKGDPRTALRAPNSVVLTEGLAKRFFGDTEPLGKVLRASNPQLREGDQTLDVQVTGILEEVPADSHLSFEMILSESTLEDFFGPEVFTDTTSNFTQFYILLRPGESVSALDAKLRSGLKRLQGGQSRNELYLRPLTQIHLCADVTEEIGVIGSIKRVRLFSIVALFVLLIAVINSVNLSTARSAHRAKEVGLRKVSGAQRTALVTQFLCESILTTFVASGLALVLMLVMRPLFPALLGQNLRIPFLDEPIWLAGIALLAMVVAVLSGLYPALVLSSFHPIRVLKGTMSSGYRNPILRKSLVVIQFFISISMIIATVVVLQQVSYLTSKDLGFRSDQVITIPLNQINAVQTEVFRAELMKNPHILNVCSSDYLPYDSINWTGTSWEGAAPGTEISINNNYVDEDFMSTYQMKLVRGRGFQEVSRAEAVSAAIVNETAAKAMGWDEPIGKRLYYGGDYRSESNREIRVVGVVKDFHLRSLHFAITPLVMFLLPENTTGSNISIKISPEQIPSTVAFIQKAFRKSFPDEAYSYHFVNEDFQRMYRTERDTARGLSSLGILAVLMACLGLFGLASFTMQQRTREIGVRRALGATALRITWLLTGEYLVLIAIANFLAWPVAHIYVSAWLEEFPYRISPQLWVFVAAGLAGAILAVGSVGLHSIKAARANPVDALRHE